MDYEIFPRPFADGTAAIFTVHGTQEIQDIGRIFSEENSRLVRIGNEGSVSQLHRTIENFTAFATHEGKPLKQIRLLDPKGEFLQAVFERFIDNTREELYAIQHEYALPLFMIGAAKIERQRLSEQAQKMATTIGAKVLKMTEEMEDPAETLGREAEQFLADLLKKPDDEKLPE